MPYGENRVIVRRGVLRFTDEERKARVLYLLCKANRLPNNEYLNTKFNEPKRYFGNFQVVYNDMVISDGDIHYQSQIIWKYEAIVNQIMQHTHCVGVNINLNALAFYEGADAGTVGDYPNIVPTEIVKPKLLLMDADTVWFSLYNNTTLNVQTYYEPLENLCFLISPSNWKEPSDQKPEAPTGDDNNPNPQEPTEDIPTDPYEPTDNDGGRTYDPDGFTGTGNWFVIFTGRDGNNGCISYSGSAPLPGATNPAITPVITDVAPDTCSGAQRCKIRYNGVVVNEPRSYDSLSFEYRQ